MTHLRISEAVPRQLLKWRIHRGLTTQRLAAMMEELGEPLHASAITKIERGDRKVSLDEVFAFAAAMAVPPVLLLVPLDGKESRLRVTDKSEIHPHLVLDWITGEGPLVTTRGAVIDHQQWKEGFHNLRLWGRLRAAQKKAGDAAIQVGRAEYIDGDRRPDAHRAGKDARKRYVAALEQLAAVLDDMEFAGIQPPPMAKLHAQKMAELNLRGGAK